MLAGTDVPTAQAIEKEANALRAELLGKSKSRLDAILVNNVIIAYLANMYSNLVSAKNTDKMALVLMRHRRAESTQRQLTSALRCLTLVREKLGSSGPRPHQTADGNGDQ